MLQQDPFKRITIDQTIVHPWMQCTEPDAAVAKQQYIAEMAIRQRLAAKRVHRVLFQQPSAEQQVDAPWPSLFLEIVLFGDIVRLS